MRQYVLSLSNRKRIAMYVASAFLIIFGLIPGDLEKYPNEGCVDISIIVLCNPTVVERCDVETKNSKSEQTCFSGVYTVIPGIALAIYAVLSRIQLLKVTIASPKHNSLFLDGEEIRFNGTVKERFTGKDVSSLLIWKIKSSGEVIGTGSNFSTSAIENGNHVIQALLPTNSQTTLQESYMRSLVEFRVAIKEPSCLQSAVQLDELQIDENLASRIPCEMLPFWTRLEPRPRSNDFSEGLRAEIRDPVFMLAKSRQMGELDASNTGTPIDAKITYKTSRITRLQTSEGSSTLLLGNENENKPLELLVEKEKITDENISGVVFNWKTRLQIGKRFELFLASDGQITTLINKFRSDETFSVSQSKLDLVNIHDLETRKFLAIMVNRSLDGKELWEIFSNHSSFPNDVATRLELTTDEINTSTNAIRDLKSWFDDVYQFAEKKSDIAWKHDSLRHEFKISIPWDKQSNNHIVLESNDYDGNPDWHSFVVNSDETNLGTHTNNEFDVINHPDDLPESDSTITDNNDRTKHFTPTNLIFNGMPNLRWWEFEDRSTDLSDIFTNATDVSKLIFMQYALAYSNDWFSFPLPLKISTLCEIKDLEVTDVFGDKTTILPSSTIDSQGWEGWNMFGLTNKSQGNDQPDEKVSNKLFLPPTLGKREESEPLEEVQFIREDSSGMSWAIEHIITNELGKPIKGFEAYRDEKLKNKQEDSTDSVFPPYVLASLPPDNWIPYVPAHSDPTKRAIQFQRAKTLKIDNKDEFYFIKPKSFILNSADVPHLVNEDALTLPGTTIKLTLQRTRWLDGRIYTWLGRSLNVSSPTGDSGLSFDDILEKINKPSNS